MALLVAIDTRCKFTKLEFYQIANLCVFCVCYMLRLLYFFFKIGSNLFNAHRHVSVTKGMC